MSLDLGGIKAAIGSMKMLTAYEYGHPFDKFLPQKWREAWFDIFIFLPTWVLCKDFCQGWFIHAA